MPVTDAPRSDPVADGWAVLTATERGAAHTATGRPSQDAVAACPLGPPGLAVAVADGHGHHRHFRSARGAQLAVAAGCEAAQELAGRLAAAGPDEQSGQDAIGDLVPAITARWRAAVERDLAAGPFTEQEQQLRPAADTALIAYGSTLMLAVAWHYWLILAQIGDGDVLGIQPDGRALQPVPGDAMLDGRHTTSLCGPRAEQEFRLAVVDTRRTPLLGLLLATDGYGNAQVAEPWAGAVSADLAQLIGGRSPDWLAGQLPAWAARCASADGSADDTTIALLLAPGAARHGQPGPGGAMPGAGEPPAVTQSRPAIVPGGTEPASFVPPQGFPGPAGPSGTMSWPVPAGSSVPAGSPGPADSSVPAGSPAAAGPPVPAVFPAAAGAVGAAAAGGAGRAGQRPGRAGRSRRPAVVIVIAVLALAAAVIVWLANRSAPAAARLPSSSGRPRASATAPAARPARGGCRVPAAGIGVPAAGASVTACAPATGRRVHLPLAGLPGGRRIALQAGGLVFVLVADTLRWWPASGGQAGWHDLGPVPAGRDQGMCLSHGVITAAAAQPARVRRHHAWRTVLAWLAASTPARQPARIGGQHRVPGNPCAAGLRQ